MTKRILFLTDAPTHTLGTHLGLLYPDPQKGTPVSLGIEMSGNRDDIHALVMNTDTVVEICLAAVRQCLDWEPG